MASPSKATPPATPPTIREVECAGLGLRGVEAGGVAEFDVLKFEEVGEEVDESVADVELPFESPRKRFARPV